MSGRRMVASARVARMLALLDRSGVSDRLERLLHADSAGLGRPRQLPVRALLLALLLLVAEGRPHLVRVAPLLNSLPQRDRQRLGVDRPGGITRRQVQALYDRLTGVLGVDGLDRFCDDLLDATMPEEPVGSSSLAVDASDIPTWGRPAGMWRGKKRPAGDPDARWRGADADRTWTGGAVRLRPDRRRHGEGPGRAGGAAAGTAHPSASRSVRHSVHRPRGGGVRCARTGPAR